MKLWCTQISLICISGLLGLAWPATASPSTSPSTSPSPSPSPSTSPSTSPTPWPPSGVCASSLSAGLTIPSPQDRAVVLEATRNTRDLGGLPTAHGQLKEGVLYRSGALCYATGKDISTINRLKLNTIVDLRVAKEIEREGLDKPGIRQELQQYVKLPMVCTYGVGGQAYLSYMDGNAEAYKGFFALLAQPQAYPLLFHCSAGKDRTGIMAALVLELLGTKRSVILEDYLQSQRNSPGLVVEASWLQGVWKRVDKAGGVRGFLKRKGVKADSFEKIVANLTEKHN